MDSDQIFWRQSQKYVGDYGQVSLLTVHFIGILMNNYGDMNGIL